MQESRSPNTALITGASSGIGEALAAHVAPRWLVRRVGGTVARKLTPPGS